MEAYLAVHPCQEAPYLEVGIAHRQAESQQDLLVAGIQEAYLVEELAYQAGSWACQEVVGNLAAGLVGAAAYQQGIQAAYHPGA